MDLLYLDFAKAFDLVDLSILVSKMNRAGVGGKALEFLISFLTDRSQRIRVGNSISGARKVRSGVPQGSVLGPVLFLVYIADLQITHTSNMTKLLKFVDDSKVLTRINCEEDVFNLQNDLKCVYGWAEANHMRWNDLKFQILRSGKNEEVINNTTVFSPDYGEVVEAKETIKDLGILVDSEFSYDDHLRKAVSKTKQKSAWALRTFSTREVPFLRTLWRTIIQCHLDYGNILWAPYSTKYKLRLLESPLREFTRRARGLQNVCYWDRLKTFKLQSAQRRVERYRIIYTWKSLNGLAPSLGLKWKLSGDNGRSGRVLEVSKVTGNSDGLKTLRRETIQHEGVKLLNILPNEIRNFSGKIASFKSLLDDYLSLFDDNPETETLKSPIVDCDGVSTNSIYYWCLKVSTNWKPKLSLVRDGHTFKVKDCLVNVGMLS